MWRHRQASWLWETLRSSQTAQRILVKERGSLCQSEAFGTFADRQQKLLAQFVVSLVCWKIQLVETVKTERRTHSKHSTSGKLQGTFILKKWEKNNPPYSQHHFTLVNSFVLVLFIHCSFVSWIEPVPMHCQRPWSPVGTAAIKHYCMFPTPSDTE